MNNAQQKEQITQQLAPLMDAENFSLPAVIEGLSQQIQGSYSTVRPEVFELLRLAAGLARE